MLFSVVPVPGHCSRPINSSRLGIHLHLHLVVLEGHDAHRCMETKQEDVLVELAARGAVQKIQSNKENDRRCHMR